MTNEEIQAFFKACDSYVLRIKLSGRPYVFPALYRFLYCCGVRCGEARKLKCCDVHLDDGLLIYSIPNLTGTADFIFQRNSSLISGKYDDAISKCFPKREYFFPGGSWRYLLAQRIIIELP